MIKKLIKENIFRKELQIFLNAVWQEDTEIDFIRLIKEYWKEIQSASDKKIKEYLRNLYNANKKAILLRTSDRFQDALYRLRD